MPFNEMTKTEEFLNSLLDEVEAYKEHLSVVELLGCLELVKSSIKAEE